MVQINIKKGNDKSFQLTFTDSLSQPIDLSNYNNIYLDISASPIVPTENIKLSLGNGITVNNNILTVEINNIQTQNLFQQNYYGDLKVKNGELISTLVKFIFNVELTSTKVID